MEYQQQLFEPDSSLLPQPITGETLYSWCVRFHRLSANTHPRLTSTQLFGNSAAGFRHDFPTHLHSLSMNTSQLFGSIENLIYDRTIISIFAQFLSSPVIATVIQKMQRGGYSRIKYHVGLRACSIATIAPLKACPSCMRDDVISFGIAWWHVEHQLPTVRICPKHDEYLLIATQEFHARGLNDWLLPTDIHRDCLHDVPYLSEPATSKLRNLCDWSIWLTKHHDRPFDNDLLRLTYHLRAKNLGWSTIDGTLRFEKLRLAFRDAYMCLENLPGFSFIRETSHDYGGFVGDLLLKSGLNKHPLKNVIMMEFLFGDPGLFIAEYERVLFASFGLNNKELWTELTDSRSHLKLLVTDAGYSAKAAAKQLCIPLSQAISFLRKEGIEYKRQHRILDQQKEDELIKLLSDGEERDAIASKLGIIKSFIINYLSKYPDLRNIWRSALQQRLVENHRSKFLQFLNDNPGLPIKSMRLDLSSSFQWLQFNDKDWLKQNLPEIWQMRGKKQS